MKYCLAKIYIILYSLNFAFAQSVSAVLMEPFNLKFLNGLQLSVPKWHPWEKGMAGWYWPFPSHKLFPWFCTNFKALQSLRSSHFKIYSDSETAILRGFASPPFSWKGRYQVVLRPRRMPCHIRPTVQLFNVQFSKFRTKFAIEKKKNTSEARDFDCTFNGVGKMCFKFSTKFWAPWYQGYRRCASCFHMQVLTGFALL